MSADLLLRRAAARLRRLWLDPRDPAGFLAERDELARFIEIEAAGRRRDAAPPTFFRAPDPPPDPRVRRLEALARYQTARIAGLERQLAQARPRPRRRQQAQDGRQLVLI